MTKMNIAKALDVNSFNCEITVNDPNYLIMSNNTADELTRLACEQFHTQKLKNNGYCGTYRGIPVAFCDLLEYGEVILV